MFTIALAILITLLCLALSAFFSGYEMGFVSLNKVRVRQEATEGKGGASFLCQFLDHPEKILAITLVGNNLILVVWTIYLGGELAKHVREPWAELLTTAVIAPLNVVFGEIMPKSLFRQHPNKLVTYLVWPLRVSSWIMYPVVAFMGAITNVLVRLSGVSKEKKGLFLSRDEVAFLFEESQIEGALAETERVMIQSVIDIGTTTVKEVMVPRIDMVAIDAAASCEELFELINQSKHSRIPVYRERIDNVVGIVHVFDLIKAGFKCPTDRIEPFIRETPFVPDTKKVGELLSELRAQQKHMAIVVDEYGGTAGLVTMEDLVEEIFGEIQDEYDVEPSLFKQVAEGAYLVDAKMDIEEANRAMNLQLPAEKSLTVGGFLMELAGKIPSKGEEFTYQDHKLIVAEADEHSLQRIIIKRQTSPSANMTQNV